MVEINCNWECCLLQYLPICLIRLRDNYYFFGQYENSAMLLAVDGYVAATDATAAAAAIACCCCCHMICALQSSNFMQFFRSYVFSAAETFIYTFKPCSLCAVFVWYGVGTVCAHQHITCMVAQNEPLKS